MMAKKDDYNIAQRFFGYRGRQGPLFKSQAIGSIGTIFQFYTRKGEK